MKKPISNFLVQFTVAELTRKLGGDAMTEEKILTKFEDQVKHTWVGRELSMRVTRNSRNWERPVRRLPPPRG